MLKYICAKKKHKPGCARSACRNTVRLAGVDSVRSAPAAPPQPLSHWWNYPSVGHELPAACRTANGNIKNMHMRTLKSIRFLKA